MSPATFSGQPSHRGGRTLCFPSVEEAEDLRTERFYYDGVRRIQEIVIDPLLKLGELTQPLGAPTIELQIAATNSEFSQSQAAEGKLDKSATPLAVVKEQIKGDPQFISFTPAVSLVREYIWGPGDGAAGVDELLVQFDEARKPWWVLQDAGGDIVALCDNGTSITGAPFVAAQWTYDAYGSVVSADHLSPHPFMHAGHKGLFFDRLDVGVADSAVAGAEALESPRLVPFANALYHNRNRVYNPQFGRFMQADPNAAGLALIEAAAYNGRGIAALAVAFDFSSRYGDGANLYEYLGSNPWNRTDPMGLEYSMANVQFSVTTEVGVQGTYYVQYGAMASAGAEYATATVGGSSIVGASSISGMGVVGGTVGGLNVAGKFVAWATAGALILAPGLTIVNEFASKGQVVRPYGIDYLGARNGYPVQNLWEKYALEQIAGFGGAGLGNDTKIIDDLGDDRLKALAPGRWEKWQTTMRSESTGDRITIHYSRNDAAGIIDDVKIVYRARAGGK